MISDSDTEYNNNFDDVNDSIDVSFEKYFSLHDALVNHDFDKRNENSDDNSTDNGDTNITVEDEENMEIDHVNIVNDLVVNDAQINAYVLRSLKE